MPRSAACGPGTPVVHLLEPYAYGLMGKVRYLVRLVRGMYYLQHVAGWSSSTTRGCRSTSRPIVPGRPSSRCGTRPARSSGSAPTRWAGWTSRRRPSSTATTTTRSRPVRRAASHGRVRSGRRSSGCCRWARRGRTCSTTTTALAAAQGARPRRPSGPRGPDRRPLRADLPRPRPGEGGICGARCRGPPGAPARRPRARPQVPPQPRPGRPRRPRASTSSPTPAPT